MLKNGFYTEGSSKNRFSKYLSEASLTFRTSPTEAGNRPRRQD
jgi:hypothetical protein